MSGIASNSASRTGVQRQLSHSLFAMRKLVVRVSKS